MKVATARAILKSYKIQPNRSEELLLDILDGYFPGKFEFNYGGLTIEGKVPDIIYVNTEDGVRSGCIIELIGNRKFEKHSDEALREREELFSKYGFRTLFIFHPELKDEDELFEKVFFWLHHNLKD